MNGVQTRFKCKLDVKRCKRFVFPPSSLLPRSNALKTKAIRYFQTDRTLTRIVSPPLDGKVLEISKTCSISRAIGESIGIEKMSAAYTEALFRELEVMITKEGLDNIFYERAFERLIPQGHSFYALDTTEYFSVELDTVNDFEQAQRLIPSQLY
mgnify:CR=1 FL=1